MAGSAGLVRTVIATLERLVTVDDVVGSTTLDGVAASATEQDVAVAPDGPLSGQTPDAELRHHRCQTARRGGWRQQGCQSLDPVGHPAWSSASQPVNPAPPTALGTSFVPLMTSLNAEPESASVSCQRSRLTTTWIGSAGQMLLIVMSSSAPTVSYWWIAQSKPPAPALRSIAAFCDMMSSPPSAS